MGAHRGLSRSSILIAFIVLNAYGWLKIRVLQREE
jgi:hypothetical protein